MPVVYVDLLGCWCIPKTRGVSNKTIPYDESEYERPIVQSISGLPGNMVTLS